MRCDGGLRRSDRRAGHKFQSLSGFLMRCDYPGKGTAYIREKFQSLSGFLMRCDIGVDRNTTGHVAVFQSLSGFLMRCDGSGACGGDGGSWVSIPIGFSDAL